MLPIAPIRISMMSVSRAKLKSKTDVASSPTSENFALSIPMLKTVAAPPSTVKKTTRTTATPPRIRAMVWKTSVQITASIPPRTVYTVTKMPITMITTLRFQFGCMLETAIERR